jgi:cardiolipin synthase
MSRFTFYKNTEEFRNAMLDAIESAEAGILCQFMNMDCDDEGSVWSDTLINSQKKGVNIKLMIDHYCGLSISDKYLFLPKLPHNWIKIIKRARRTKRMFQNMQNNGINLKRTNPYTIFKPKSLIKRDHRKILIVDNRILFLGGYNPAMHNLSWHDVGVSTTDSKIIESVRQIFFKKFDNNQTDKFNIVDENVKILANNKMIIDELIRMIEKAEEHVYVESPYINSPEIFKQLNKKFKEGVKVKVIIPQKNNKIISELFFRYYKFRYKGFIFRRTDPKKMTHVKLALVDDIVIIGSSNFNSLDVEEITFHINDKNLKQDIMDYFIQSGGEIE